MSGKNGYNDKGKRTTISDAIERGEFAAINGDDAAMMEYDIRPRTVASDKKLYHESLATPEATEKPFEYPKLVSELPTAQELLERRNKEWERKHRFEKSR